ncbi:hypothetical protein AVEN_153251-1 [Araneus ventricosus]|uniref:Uncharacterized protein n=1 Tax=Araneus ventricosus TaxID=182803 RepID=A0A4Y2K1B5_ARAVE|nr:hypothetical protein AVEN_153251-1 [Araneus ventricosus]
MRSKQSGNSFSWRAHSPTLEGRKTQKQEEERVNWKGGQTLGYLGVVNPDTPKENVPLSGFFCKADKLVCCVAFCNGLLKMRDYCSQILSHFIVATIGSFKPEIAVFDV